MSDFGKILKSLRKKARMSQYQLADALHMSKSAVSGYEQDARLPSLEMIARIADLFHVSVDYLLGREQKMRRFNIDGLKKEDIELVDTIIRFLRDKNHDDDDKMMLT